MVSAAPYRLIFQPEPEIRAAAFAHEAATFGSVYSVPYQYHVAEFAPYEAQSAFVVVVDSDDRVRGSMRLVTPGPAGLKTIIEAARSPWMIDAERAALAVGMDLVTTWDVASLAVGHGLGRDRLVVTAALYHGLTVAARRNRVTSLLMTIDDRVRAILQNHFGLYTTPLPGATSQPFEGSPATTPVFGHCAAMLALQRRRNPEAYRLLTLGIGLDGVSVPPEEHFDLLERALSVAEPMLTVA